MRPIIKCTPSPQSSPIKGEEERIRTADTTQLGGRRFINKFLFANFPKEHLKILRFASVLAVNACGIKANDICFVLVDDKKIKLLNRKYIKSNKITDIISFSYNTEVIEGDIYIARGRSKKQAEQEGHSWRNELIYLVLHGVLHLAGYTDYSPSKKKKMFALQDKLFAKIVK